MSVCLYKCIECIYTHTHIYMGVISYIRVWYKVLNKVGNKQYMWAFCLINNKVIKKSSLSYRNNDYIGWIHIGISHFL